MMVRPVVSATTFTLLIGMLLAAGGLYQLIASLSLHYKGWGWDFGNGAVSLLLGFAIFDAWPSSSLWVIGTFIGIDLVIRGFSAFMLALSLRAVTKNKGTATAGHPRATQRTERPSPNLSRIRPLILKVLS